MKICVIANRFRVDQFRSLVAALITLGHDVFYWVDTADAMAGAAATKRTILDHRFDLGISADWCFFADPSSPLNRRLDGFPPFINLCFNSPFDALLELSAHRDIPGFLAENRIWLGLLSPLDHRALAAFGVTRHVDLPVGLIDRCLIYGDDDRLFPVGFMPAAQHQAYLQPQAALRDRLAGRYAEATEALDLVYFGTAALHVTDDIPTFCFGPIAPRLPRPFSAYVADYGDFDPEITPDRRGARIDDYLAQLPEFAGADPMVWLLRRRLGAQLERGHRLAMRRARIRALQDRHGPRLALFGDDWARFGIAARPAEAETGPLRYHASAISLDFGSLSYDSLMFPRSCDIVQHGGFLLQARLADSDALLGDLAPAVTFDGQDDMLDRTDRWLADPAGRRDAAAGIAARLGRAYDLPRLIDDAISRVLA